MVQIKTFRTKLLDDLDGQVNGWLEMMQRDPTFRLLEQCFSDSHISGNSTMMFIYECESEKEKERKYEVGTRLLEIMEGDEYGKSEEV